MKTVGLGIASSSLVAAKFAVGNCRTRGKMIEERNKKTGRRTNENNGTARDLVGNGKRKIHRIREKGRREEEELNAQRGRTWSALQRKMPLSIRDVLEAEWEKLLYSEVSST